ncbi:hypothetical protein [Usitatibacter palustris]|uniref:Uncharacterized protein n=1 Tax=Usitatibacter palustris TaxID=2732487 RepID=A0A6M4H4W4_9PROT|nr:hypothetical protein [Usitatibacter palustris]QJR14205.1 hypothetical protein DSM104440_00998 [Usitatibacter palustris]
MSEHVLDRFGTRQSPDHIRGIYDLIMSFSGSGAQGVPVTRADIVAGSGILPVRESADAELDPPWAAKLGLIKAALGLTMSQLADVLQVGRPTVYSWMSDNASAEPREGNRTRIEEIYGCATKWLEKSQRPALGLGSNVVIDGRDIVWHLSQANIDEQAVDALIEALGAVAVQENEARHAKSSLVANLRARGFADAPQSRDRTRRRK